MTPLGKQDSCGNPVIRLLGDTGLSIEFCDRIDPELIGTVTDTPKQIRRGGR